MVRCWLEQNMNFSNSLEVLYIGTQRKSQPSPQGRGLGLEEAILGLSSLFSVWFGGGRCVTRVLGWIPTQGVSTAQGQGVQMAAGLECWVLLFL